MIFRCSEGRFSVGAVLSVGVALNRVEEGNQPIGGVEGGLCRFLNLTPKLGL